MKSDMATAPRYELGAVKEARSDDVEARPLVQATSSLSSGTYISLGSRDSFVVIEVAETIASVLRFLSITDHFREASDKVGLPVCFPRELGGLPCLLNSSGRPIPLYEIVEEIDGHVDLGEVADSIPGVSYADISGAVQFVRKLLQLNVHGVDIDDIEDEFLVAEGLADELRAALDEPAEG